MSQALNLDQFSGGSDHWYRHPLSRSITYTDGVKYVAEKAGAYWLLDKIVACQHIPAVRREVFQTWKLAVSGSSATVTVEDGNKRTVYAEKVEFTDFPEPGITVYFTDNVILLPSEY